MSGLAADWLDKLDRFDWLRAFAGLSKVNVIHCWPALEQTVQIVTHRLEGPGLGYNGERADMRREDRTVQAIKRCFAGRFTRAHVQRRAGKALAFKCPEQSLFVHHTVTGG